MKKPLIPLVCVSTALAFVLGACGAGGTEATTSDGPAEMSSPSASDPPSEAATDGPSFENGVLTTSELKIQITSHKVIKVGEEGNEHGEKPVIGFWYTTTNLTDDDVSPMNFLYVFSAYQDNNPNAENEIEVGSLPDDRFLDTQTENIKKGGTVENAVAYELDDLVTPVDLVAVEGLDEVIGKTTYQLK